MKRVEIFENLLNLPSINKNVRLYVRGINEGFLMTPNQLALVQSSWEKVVPIAPDAAKLFYGRLFEVAPSVRGLFKGDIEEQGKKLMTIITTVVRGLKQFDRLEMAVWQLGRRHVAYGAIEAHYGVVADTLLWTLQQGLGPAFTNDIKEAWQAALNIIAGVMIGGANCEYANFEVWKAQQA